MHRALWMWPASIWTVRRGEPGRGATHTVSGSCSTRYMVTRLLVDQALKTLARNAGDGDAATASDVLLPAPEERRPFRTSKSLIRRPHERVLLKNGVAAAAAYLAEEPCGLSRAVAIHSGDDERHARTIPVDRDPDRAAVVLDRSVHGKDLIVMGRDLPRQVRALLLELEDDAAPVPVAELQRTGCPSSRKRPGHGRCCRTVVARVGQKRSHGQAQKRDRRRALQGHSASQFTEGARPLSHQTE